MALLTKWEVSDIQAAIATDLGDGRDLYMPNISWGFFKSKGMEADLLWLRGTHLEEYEIKRSKEDFKADFKKLNFHDDVRILKLHYVLPEAMAGDWLKAFCKENYTTFRRTFDFQFYREYDCSIILPDKHNDYRVDPKFTTDYYLTQDMLRWVMLHDPAHNYYRRLYAEEISELYRLVVIRYWARMKQELDKRRYALCEHDPRRDGFFLNWWDKEKLERAKREDDRLKTQVEERSETV